jgi:hypothetical protein
MARLREIPDGPNNSVGTLEVEGMRDMKQLVKLVGTSNGQFIQAH